MKPASNGGEPHTQNVVGKLPKMRTAEEEAREAKEAWRKPRPTASSNPQSLNGRPFPQLLLHWPTKLMKADDEQTETTQAVLPG